MIFLVFPPIAFAVDFNDSYVMDDSIDSATVITEGVDRVFQMCIGLHGDWVLEDASIWISTIQQKNITYLADSKLAIKMINRLNKISRVHGVTVCRQRKLDKIA